MSHNNLHGRQHSKWLTSKCSNEKDLNGSQPFPRPVYIEYFPNKTQLTSTRMHTSVTYMMEDSSSSCVIVISDDEDGVCINV